MSRPLQRFWLHLPSKPTFTSVHCSLAARSDVVTQWSLRDLRDNPASSCINGLLQALAGASWTLLHVTLSVTLLH